jgi:F-type H+-transporting ATPase subunit b
MPQIDPQYYLSELIWLFISFSIIFAFIKYYVAPRMYAIFDEREAKISGNLRKSEKLKNEAMKFESEYNAKLNHAYKSSTIQISKALEEFNRHTQVKRENRDKESALLIKEAEKRIIEFRKKSEKQLIDLSISYVQSIVFGMVGVKVDNLEEIRSKLLNVKREV